MIDSETLGEGLLAFAKAVSGSLDLVTCWHTRTNAHRIDYVNALRISRLCIMHSMKEPYERLVWARKQAGLENASEAARKMRINVQTYLSHEEGNRGLARNVRKYAQFFKVRWEWLLHGDEPIRPSEKPEILQKYDALPDDKKRAALRYLDFLNTDTN